MHQRKVQGFCGKTAKILALEQRIIVLKALACKGFRVVQYTLCTGGLQGDDGDPCVSAGGGVCWQAKIEQAVP